MALGTALALGLGGAAASLGGNVIGALASRGDKDKAQQAMDEAFAQIQAIGAPPDLSKEIIREKLKQVGVYTPQLEQAIELESSKVAKIQEDPALRDAQMNALQILQQKGSTGLTPEDRAAYNELRRQAEKDAEGKRQQILQNFAARGMGGSGAELAAQLSAAQAGDEALSSAGDRIAAQASRNALESLVSAGQLGGSIRGQEFDINKARAQAEDELNRFNVANQIARQQRNVGSQNEAQAMNLREQQRISDININQANQEKLRQAEAQRQHYLDQLTQAQSKANALTGQANQLQQRGNETAGNWAKIGSGLGGMLGQGSAYLQDQAKEDKYYANQQSVLDKLLKAKKEKEDNSSLMTMGALTGGWNGIGGSY